MDTVELSEEARPAFYWQKGVKLKAMRTGHTSAPRGSKVIVHMRDGSKLIGKFLKTVDNKIYVENHEPFMSAKIRTMSIYRARPLEPAEWRLGIRTRCASTSDYAGDGTKN